jgi:pyruvate kinase
LRKTKIVCTLGPAVDDYKTLAKLCASGMNVARFNFSHGDYEEQSKRIEIFKSIREELNLPIPMMLDTKGPEIRIGKFENKKVTLNEGEIFTLIHNEIMGDSTKVYVNYNDLYKEVSVGNRILINDGLIELEVIEIINQDIKCKIMNGGILTDKKSVNIPGLSLNFPDITEKDKKDIIFGIENGFDIIAASFIRKTADILAIREVLRQNQGEHIKIIAKIENREGVDNFDKILEASDGIMVARGDLGVEIPMEEVPMLQKKFIKKCYRAAKPVIVATQMLESMINNPRPTRAEVSDVANAVLDGASAVMLSGESAAGKYPIECVKTMSKIAETTEAGTNYWGRFVKKESEIVKDQTSSMIVSHSLCEIAMKMNAKAIFTLSMMGKTPRAIVSFRPGCPI